jgi:hypothetical protein
LPGGPPLLLVAWTSSLLGVDFVGIAVTNKKHAEVAVIISQGGQFILGLHFGRGFGLELVHATAVPHLRKAP